MSSSVPPNLVDIMLSPLNDDGYSQAEIIYLTVYGVDILRPLIMEVRDSPLLGLSQLIIPLDYTRKACSELHAEVRA